MFQDTEVSVVLTTTSDVCASIVLLQLKEIKK